MTNPMGELHEPALTRSTMANQTNRKYSLLSPRTWLLTWVALFGAISAGFVTILALALGMNDGHDHSDTYFLFASVTLSLLFVVIGGIALYILILRPLYSLRDTLEQHRRGESFARAGGVATDEMAELTVAVNETLDKIDAQTSVACKLAVCADRGREAMLLLDTQGHIEWVNTAFVELTSQSLDDVLGKDFRSWLAEGDRDENTMIDIGQALTNCKNLRVALQYETNNQSRKQLTLEIEPVQNALGNASGFVTILTPSADTQSSNEQLLLKQIEQAYQFAPFGYHLLDGDGNIEYVNDTELRWMGASREHVLGKPFLSFIDNRYHAALQQRVRTVDGREQLDWTECEIVRSDGTRFPVLMSAAALRSREGQLMQVHCTLVDITERKRSEEETVRMVRMKDEFLANMSHELRTPLNAVLGLTEILRDGFLGALNSKQADAVETIHTSGDHLLALINDILDLSKIEAGQFELVLSDVSVDELCIATLDMIRHTAERKPIELTYQSHVGPATVTVEPRRFKQCLLNLLSNALKFTPAGGHVGLEVSLDCTTNQLIFAVWDTGIGISSQDQTKLFRPFFQASTGLTRNYEGTGLGLSLTKRLVELHGGTLRVQSTKGEGTKFEIVLSIDERASNIAPASPAGTRDRRSSISLLAPHATQNVAIVADEDERCVENTSRYLHVKGYSVVHTHDVSCLLEMVRREKPTLVLMNAEQPGAPTVEAIRQLCTDSSLPRIFVIVMGNPVSIDNEESGRAAGADEYLVKPIVLKDLGGILQRAAKAVGGA